MATIGSLEFETVIKTDSLKKSEDDIKKAVADITKAISEQSDKVSDSNKNVQDSAKSAANTADKTMKTVGKTADKIIAENQKVAENIGDVVADTVTTTKSAGQQMLDAIRNGKDSVSQLGDEVKKTGDQLSVSVSAGKNSINELSDSIKTVETPDNLMKVIDSLLDSLDKTPSSIHDVIKGFDELSESNTKKIAELDSELKKLTKDLSALGDNRNSDEAKNIQERIKLIRAEIGEYKDLQKEVEKNQKVLKENEFANVKKSVDDYTDSLIESIAGNNKFGQSMVNLARSGQGINGLFDGMKIGIKSLGQTLMGLMANPAFLAIAGVAGVAAGFKWWWDYNKGVEEATRKTQQLTGLSGADLKDFRAEVTAIADTFGKEFDEVLLATNALSKQMGIEAKEALDIVKDGFVVGADVNGEFLDTLREYPAYFKEAGLSAKQFVAITAMGAQEGVFSDKAVDAIKEGNLRLREMTTATQQAIDGIGLSSTEIMKQLTDGTITTFDAMQQISEVLSELPESSTEVGTAIADIFGGPGEDAGLAFLSNLQNINGDLDKMKEESGEIATVQDRLLNSNIELEQAIAEVFDTTGGFFENLETNLKTMWNEYLINILNYIQQIKDYIVEIWNENEWVRQGVGILTNHIGNMMSVTMKGLKAIFETIIEIGLAIGDLVQGKFDSMKNRLKNIGDAWVDYGQSIEKVFTDLFSGEGADRFNQKIEEKIDDINDKKKEKEGKGGAGGGGDTKLTDILAKRKKEYEEYARNIAASDKTISDAAIKNGKTLMAQGATWEIYLTNLRKKYKGNADAIKKINDELIALQKQSLMDLWKDQLGDNVNLGKNLTEQLAAYQAAREKIAADDPLKYQKNEFIDDQIRELLKSSSADYIDAQKAARDYRESSKKEWERYADDLTVINAKIATTTNADELSILNNQKSATELRMQMAKNKDRIDQEKQLTDKLIAIELDRQKQIADIEKDESLSRQIKDEMIDRVTVAAQNDIKLARNEFAEVDGDFVQTMLSDMQSVMGQQMNFYIAKIQELQTKLKTMNPESVEYMQLNGQLQALTQSYEILKTKSLQSTSKMARDKSMTILKDSLNDFGNQLQNIGGEIGDVAGDVISATGQMFNGVVSLTTSITRFSEINAQTIEGVSAAGVKAIKAVEKASVILGMIGMIMQLVNAVRGIGADKSDVDDLYNSVESLRNTLKDVKDSADIADLRNSKTSIFGDDSWGLLTTNIQIAEKALNDFNEAQKKLVTGNGLLQNTTLMNTLRALKGDGYVDSLQNRTIDEAVAAMRVQTKEAKNGFMGIGKKSAEYSSLKQIAPDLFDQNGKLSFPALSEFQNSDLFTKLDKENQTLINNLVKQWDDYNSAIDEVKNNFKSMFDGVGSEIMDSMVEMFKGGEDAIDHFNETWDSMIENMIKSMLFSKMIQPEIEKLTANLEKVGFFNDPTANLTKAIGVLGDAKKNIYNAKDGISAALQSFSDIGEKNGLNLFAKNLEDSADNAEKQNTLSGAIKGASQESIDLLAGQTNAVRVNQVESISIMRQQLAANIEINMSIIKNGMILTNILDEIRSSGNLRSQGLDI